MKTKRAFTLLELLVVTAIIAILASLLVPVLATARERADCVRSGKNLKALVAGIMTYAAQHDSELPKEGEDQPTWQSSATVESQEAWYNAIPRMLGSRGVGDFVNHPEAFYGKANLLFVSAAKYPENREERPFFGLSMNSKLRVKELTGSAVRLAAMQQPARTVILQESGLPGEPSLPGQDASKYDGQSKSYASRSVARYNGKIYLAFGDGHCELINATDVVSTDGEAFYPQTGPSGGAVQWTMDPDANAND